MTISDILRNKIEDEAADANKGYGLLIDTDGAARNRANIERMRKQEVDKNDLRSWQPVLNTKVNITQEVIKVVVKTEGKTKGQLFYEKHAEIARLKTLWYELSVKAKEVYEDKANGVIKPRKSETKAPVTETPFRGHDTKPVLPPWSEIKDRSENIIIAWLEAVSCSKQ